ncbi:MAG TPA: hypothetical protein VMW52_10180 [Phycisphaerae bacterium]|nr:hypothetical protein [Phycisphaerae bacterium]
MKYVIERMNGVTREWWTGQRWSQVDTDATWYDTRSAAEQVVASAHRGRAAEVVGYDWW